MRKGYFGIIIMFAVFVLVLFPRCSSKNPTTGSLKVTVLNYQTNQPVVNELLYIASSYDNLKNKVYLNSLYTDANGQVMFHDLTPMLVYYDTQTWDNYGATQVYAGIDMHALLYVNTPPVKK